MGHSAGEKTGGILVEEHAECGAAARQFYGSGKFGRRRKNFPQMDRKIKRKKQPQATGAACNLSCSDSIPQVYAICSRIRNFTTTIPALFKMKLMPNAGKPIFSDAGKCFLFPTYELLPLPDCNLFYSLL